MSCRHIECFAPLGNEILCLSIHLLERQGEAYSSSPVVDLGTCLNVLELNCIIIICFYVCIPNKLWLRCVFSLHPETNKKSAHRNLSINACWVGEIRDGRPDGRTDAWNHHRVLPDQLEWWLSQTWGSPALFPLWKQTRAFNKLLKDVAVCDN